MASDDSRSLTYDDTVWIMQRVLDRRCQFANHAYPKEHFWQKCAYRVKNQLGRRIEDPKKLVERWETQRRKEIMEERKDPSRARRRTNKKDVFRCLMDEWLEFRDQLDTEGSSRDFPVDLDANTDSGERRSPSPRREERPRTSCGCQKRKAREEDDVPYMSEQRAATAVPEQWRSSRRERMVERVVERVERDDDMSDFGSESESRSLSASESPDWVEDVEARIDSFQKDVSRMLDQWSRDYFRLAENWAKLSKW
ncbi:hypothetical protein VTN96DRAFT_6217 [Rasamsonia emersonii]